MNEVISVIIELKEFLSQFNRSEFISALDEIISELESKKFNNEKISKNAQVTLFGGMLSLNDIWIHEDNGDVSSDYKKDNKRLDRLREKITRCLDGRSW